MSPQSGGFTLSAVRTRDHLEPVDVRVTGGVISGIEPAADPTGAQDRYLIPGLVESHIHLEKAYLLDRMPREAATLAEAIRMTAALKATFTRSDIRRRSLRVLRAGLAHGVTTFRAHVELDDVLELRAIDTLLELRDEVRGRVDLQIVAFPQEGLFTQRRGLDLMRAAILSGIDAIGGIPYADSDAGQHLDAVFALAETSGLPLDFHVDLSDDPDRLDIVGIAQRTIAAGLQGRVNAGHVTSLGSADSVTLAATVDLLRQADISVITLPTTDVFLNGRSDSGPPRRGLTPVARLLEGGVNVAVSTNNIQNAFTPFGRGSLIDTAVLLASLCLFGSAEEALTVVDMMSTRAARAIGADASGLAVGAPATFSVWPLSHEREILGDVDRPIASYLRGAVVSPEDLP